MENFRGSSLGGALQWDVSPSQPWYSFWSWRCHRRSAGDVVKPSSLTGGCLNLSFKIPNWFSLNLLWIFQFLKLLHDVSMVVLLVLQGLAGLDACCFWSWRCCWCFKKSLNSWLMFYSSLVDDLHVWVGSLAGSACEAGLLQPQHMPSSLWAWVASSQTEIYAPFLLHENSRVRNKDGISLHWSSFTVPNLAHNCESS